MPQTRIHAYHTNTTDAWEAMLSACERATKSIHLEEYVLDPDTIGTRFCEVLKRQAFAGVKVHLLLDWWGCREFKASHLCRQLGDAGVSIRFFRAPSWRWIAQSPRFFPRDHRKILILDEDEAFIGGVCLYDKVKNWRDTMVQLSGGGIAKQLLHVFHQTWHKTSNEDSLHKAHPDFETDAHFSIYANAPDSDENQFSGWLIEHIEQAKQSIKLSTPYFTPGHQLMSAFLAALGRGVNIEIILSHYSKFAPYSYGKHCLGELIKAGAAIYYYQPIMLHLKMMLVDEQNAAIGSCNLDGLSLYRNQEVMLTSCDEAFTRELSSHFETDKTASARFSYADWESRPLHQKIAGYALQPFTMYL